MKRTIIYVDGFNLYYGALKQTPYKWLDLKALFSRVLPPDQNKIVAIKYFTARVSGSLNDPHKAEHQDAYIRALEHTTPEFHAYFGQFTTHPTRAKLVEPINGVRWADVWRTNEKGSDVNLAVHMVNDAWLNAYDCAFMVSRDSDLAEAICLVKTFHPRRAVGVCRMPKPDCPTPKELMEHADFVKNIRNSALAASQFPNQIPGANITKPPDW
jgi:uncharacterized LabA/DUF88 family protein